MLSNTLEQVRFQLSINKNMINKANPSIYGWRNAEFDGEELANHVQNGFAFSPGVLKPRATGRKPSIKDIEFAQVLALDIDNDIKTYNKATKCYDKHIKSIEEGYLTYQQAINDPFIKENAMLAYTTPSHQHDWERLRIVFVVDDKITSPEDYRNRITTLIDRFGGDKSCSNIDRLFYGHRDCELVYFGNILRIEEVQKAVLL